MSYRHIARIFVGVFTALGALPAFAGRDTEAIPLGIEVPTGEAPDFGLGALPIRCFATPNGGVTVFSTTDAAAVRQALGAASPGAIVKVAGCCAGTTNQGGNLQVALITQTLTLAGGYTTTNWTTAFPITQPATLTTLPSRICCISMARQAPSLFNSAR